MVRSLLTRVKHLHDRIISLRGGIWVRETSLTPPSYFEMPIPSKKVIGEGYTSIAYVSTILRLDLRNVLMVWYLFFWGCFFPILCQV